MLATFPAVATAQPSFPAFAGPDGATLLDWAGYAREAREVADDLAARGVRAGDVVPSAPGDHHERYVVETALLHLGARSTDGPQDDVPVVPAPRDGGPGRLCTYGPAAQRIAHRAQLAGGHTIVCVPDPRQLAPALVATRPTHVVGAPQLYEGLQAAVLGLASADPAGPLARALRGGKADAAVLLGLRSRLGLDRAEWLGVAGGCCPPATRAFFAAIGLPLTELDAAGSS